VGAARQGYDGKDRWYLEALGIGADKQWDTFFAAWQKEAGNAALSNPAGRDIVWRARTGASVPLLASLAADSKEPMESRLRYFRAFDFNPDKAAKSAALVKMLEGTGSEQTQIKKLALTHLDPGYIKQSPVARQALTEVLNSLEGTPEFVELVGRYELKEENPRLLKLAQAQSSTNLGRNAANALLKQGGAAMVAGTIGGKDEKAALEVISPCGAWAARSPSRSWKKPPSTPSTRWVCAAKPPGPWEAAVVVRTAPWPCSRKASFPRS
jgi:hypothetical protein